MLDIECERRKPTSPVTALYCKPQHGIRACLPSRNVVSVHNIERIDFSSNSEIGIFSYAQSRPGIRQVHADQGFNSEWAYHATDPVLAFDRAGASLKRRPSDAAGITTLATRTRPWDVSLIVQTTLVGPVCEAGRSVASATQVAVVCISICRNSCWMIGRE